MDGGIRVRSQLPRDGVNGISSPPALFPVPKNRVFVPGFVTGSVTGAVRGLERCGR